MAATLSLTAGCSRAGGSGPLTAVVDPYARAGELAKLPDGRRVNLRCSGQGSPTVLLESGFAASSSAWVKVQPQLSRTSRVCAYDRAGYGFSDPGPLPRDGAAIARDLDQALVAAGIPGPYIVVGHSSGGLYGRLFAARRARDVQGLVLLDPTVERRAAQPSGDGLDGIRGRVRRCLATAQANPQSAPAAWSGCLPARPNAHDAEVARRPQTWTTQLSELDELFGRTSDQVMRIPGVLAGVPIYVITASATSGERPAIGFNPRTGLEIQHLVMARASRNGSQRTVVSSHLVMLDRPDVVIAAVQEMIAAAREQRAPAPLGPSEELTLPDSNLLQELFETPEVLRNLAPPGDTQAQAPK